MTTSTAPNPASPAAIDFLRALHAERDMGDLFAEHMAEREATGDFDAEWVSGAITLAKMLPRRPQKPAVAEGMYRNAAGDVFRVVRARSSANVYAKRMTAAGKWEYAPGATKTLLPEHRMDFDAVAEVSAQIGHCAVCGLTLTAKVSVEAGIGPVCRTRI